MNIDDALLMAYADGELDAATATRVEDAIAGDAASAHVVERHRALRARLARAYDGTLAEPVPPHLAAMLQPAAGAASSNCSPVSSAVLPMPVSAARRSTRRSPSRRIAMAMAACLVVGVGIGFVLSRPESTQGGALVDDAMVARGGLAHGLDDALSGEPVDSVSIALSFRASDGRYCRAFTMAESTPVAGIACRDGERWRVSNLVHATAHAGGEYRQAASSLPPSVLAEVDARIDGDALDAGGERAARAANWQAAPPRVRSH